MYKCAPPSGASYYCGCYLPFWEDFARTEPYILGGISQCSVVCISVGARWLSHVVDRGTLIPERAMWIAMIVGDTWHGILNVCAPIDVCLRCGFGQSIASSLPDMDAWMVGGYFNNLEA